MSELSTATQYHEFTISTLLLIITATESQLGYDHTIHRIRPTTSTCPVALNAKCSYICEVPADSGPTQYFKTLNLLHETRNPEPASECATRVWEVMEVSPQSPSIYELLYEADWKVVGDHTVVIKDSWHTSTSEEFTEKEIQDALFRDLQTLADGLFLTPNSNLDLEGAPVNERLKTIPCSLRKRIIESLKGCKFQQYFNQIRVDYLAPSTPGPPSASEQPTTTFLSYYFDPGYGVEGDWVDRFGHDSGCIPWSPPGGTDYHGFGTGLGMEWCKFRRRRYRVVYDELCESLWDDRYGPEEYFEVLRDVHFGEPGHNMADIEKLIIVGMALARTDTPGVDVCSGLGSSRHPSQQHPRDATQRWGGRIGSWDETSWTPG
ncbi:hypothetical protein P691DRAFT_763457 [Macrolepiota fuliginosa MF-IS2]|uniref:Uncharacterized protein n=1 Tax=Macrolepiota fuliginosa MF-IS2 TaxID=1400762 RepID=A0A9P5X652_9AGAR|nr:hypothetical protein P691DRAFT_763457 [Macrolepiota fuliginosa MF-IS2]